MQGFRRALALDIRDWFSNSDDVDGLIEAVHADPSTLIRTYRLIGRAPPDEIIERIMVEEGYWADDVIKPVPIFRL